MGFKRARKNTASTTFKTFEPALGVISYVDYLLLSLYLFLTYLSQFNNKLTT